jgi:hypothetical protein
MCFGLQASPYWESAIRMLRRIEKDSAGEKPAPLLLVKDRENAKVIIADGYHTVYSFNEDAVIPCKIV